MQAVRKLSPQPGFELVDIPEPTPGPRDLLVKVRATSMCGTDVHIYNWDPPWSTGRMSPPKTIGHEVCGEVIELGSDITGFEVGDLISAESHIFDDTCDLCKTNNKHICRNVKFYSIDTDGFWAEYALIPVVSAWKNPKDMNPEIATLQESMGNSVYTVAASNVKDKDVAIFGLGPTGLFSVGIAKALGAKTVYAVAGSKIHLDIAKKMGADVIINRHDGNPEQVIMDATDKLGVDVSLEMAGKDVALQQALNVLKPTGQVTILGLPTKEISLDVSKQIVMKDVTVRGIYGRRIWETWELTTKLLRDGLDISPIITHKLPLSKFQEGIDAMKSGESGKVVMFPGK
ncbi:MAG: L-threonine 3-dehydrogenase [Nanoarchaeota archaeon]|nr:L-threonine 3-dehydrogenase [Nanoarchaeota archaeon]